MKYKSVVPHEYIFTSRLSAGDDPEFWREALGTLFRDVEAIDLRGRDEGDAVLQIGACSHWSHPHWVRWPVAGGFAAAHGYQGAGIFGFGLPEFDWHVLLRRDDRASTWVPIERIPSKRSCILRVALPTRTRRHPQAVVSALWLSGSPAMPHGKHERRYGFRKTRGAWRMVVARDYTYQKRRIRGPRGSHEFSKRRSV